MVFNIQKIYNYNFLILRVYTKFCNVRTIYCYCAIIEKMEFLIYLGLPIDYQLKRNYYIERVIKLLRKYFYIFKDFGLNFNIKLLNIIHVITHYIKIWGKP